MNGGWWFLLGFGSAVGLELLRRYVVLMGPLGLSPYDRGERRDPDVAEFSQAPVSQESIDILTSRGFTQVGPRRWERQR